MAFIYVIHMTLVKGHKKKKYWWLLQNEWKEGHFHSFSIIFMTIVKWWIDTDKKWQLCIMAHFLPTNRSWMKIPFTCSKFLFHGECQINEGFNMEWIIRQSNIYLFCDLRIIILLNRKKEQALFLTLQTQPFFNVWIKIEILI